MKRIRSFGLWGAFIIALTVGFGKNGFNLISTAWGQSGEASINGTVTLKGTAPKSRRIRMAADPTCHSAHKSAVLSETYVIGKAGEIKNVLVYVKEGLEGKTFKPSAEKVVLNQEGCLYSPHVIGIQVKQSLEITNSDSTMHNVNARAKVNRRFNIAQPIKNMKTIKKFTKPEIAIPFKCDVHPWMAAYVAVVAHPFFNVSDAAGKFEIKSLPAGTYVLEAWHEKLGTATKKVTLGKGQTKSVSFSFTPKT